LVRMGHKHGIQYNRTENKWQELDLDTWGAMILDSHVQFIFQPLL
jgi:hypothetical protein